MTGQNEFRSVVYFVNWAIYARNHNPQDLPAEKLTHVLYAFANVRPESGKVYLTDTWSDTDKHYPSDSWNDVGTNLYGCLKQLFLLKKRNRQLRVLLSIGGWTYSSNFAAPMATASGRSTFASSAVALVRDLGLDGLDIDWEYPRNADEARNLVALLKACREALDEAGRTLSPTHHFELTVACPAGPTNYQLLDLRGMDPYLDSWNLMAYDFAGSWDAVAGHHANLFPSTRRPASTPFSADAAVAYYLSQGIASHKLVLGMPLYGRAFENTAGPGTAFAGVGQGTWERGVYDYKTLPLPGSQTTTEVVVVVDRDVGASYCYGTETRNLVSYDTVEMARLKAAWLEERGLGGAMWWESSADLGGERSLIGNVVDVLCGGGGGDGDKRDGTERHDDDDDDDGDGMGQGRGRLERGTNCLTYPTSRYANVRLGFPGEGEAELEIDGG